MRGERPKGRYSHVFMAATLTLHPIEAEDCRPLCLGPEEPAIVGRHSGCAVSLPEEGVSREHASIEWREIAWFVTDLDSKNGTRLDGSLLKPNEPALLRDQDVVQFGGRAFRVELPGVGSAGQPAGRETYRTRASIFLRLRDERADVRELNWETFRARYAPVIVGFARNMGLAPQDADDVLQDVLLAFFQVAPRFEYDPGRGRFRGYLKLVTRRVIAASVRRAARAGIPSEDLDGEQPSELDAEWDRLWSEKLLERAVAEARAQFEARTMEAFELYGMRNVPVQEVADRLGLSIDSVHSAKSRVLKVVQEIVDRLRAEEG